MRNFISTSQRSYLWLSDHFRLDPDVSGSRFLFSCSTLNVKHVACRCCSCILKFPFPEKHSHFRNWNPPFKVICRLISLHICWLSPSFVPFLADQTHKNTPNIGLTLLPIDQTQKNILMDAHMLYEWNLIEWHWWWFHMYFQHHLFPLASHFLFKSKPPRPCWRRIWRGGISQKRWTYKIH